MVYEDKSDINSSRHSTYINHDYRALMLFKNGLLWWCKRWWCDFVHDEFRCGKIYGGLYDNVRWLAFVGRDTHGVGAHYDEYDKARKELVDQEYSQVRVRWSKVTDWQKEHLYFTGVQTRLYQCCLKQMWHMTERFTNMVATQVTTRIQLMPMGTLNIPKWHELLDRSIEKYKDYVIRDKDFSI